ncbi:hypothetical protein C5C18_06605 [Rathayibacter tritici]|nr:hypothetical protein C5C06_02140 [Rathayibacter tritici]PPF69063.1 hypothetical protein C5C21_04190 [Rathayibacter tritici]PPG07779.1 hypothetical protein C5C18_06605 [Rathayibacter tritici]PPI12664.1 hypothetical protein C5D07_12470 [Rathayibacter tritici]
MSLHTENESALWIESCTDEEFVRVCTIAHFLLYHGPHTASGRSMSYAQAGAIAAVSIHERAPRKLKRHRRDFTHALPDRSPWPKRRTNDIVMAALPTYDGVNSDVIDF